MKYTLRYNGKTVTRNADTAQEAVEKLCDQYGWRCTIKQYDADTRGHEWAECAADTEGGINWNLTILATRKEDCDSPIGQKGNKMKSYIQLANIANTYYDIWTDDGIDIFHAGADEIAAWLKREDLRTDADTELDDLTDDEFEKIASMIAEMVRDKLEENGCKAEASKLSD